ncbi:MAG: D,D-heptose 1,7-bisphosphate phosphatase [Reyranella sp.]|nr:D,D-heptose 1,7-bisphosphate phosphatase [Reyranella sp.]
MPDLSAPTPPRLVLLDRDGVVLVNAKTNVKCPEQIRFLARAPEAIARLTAAGIKVAICTNQPEIARGVMSREQLCEVHEALQAKLAGQGGIVDLVLCCTSDAKSPRLKPAPGMIRQALARHNAIAAETPFVGDQLDDLKAAFHAGCPRVLVRTGLGRKTLTDGLPDYVQPVRVADDLFTAVDDILSGKVKNAGSR